MLVSEQKNYQDSDEAQDLGSVSESDIASAKRKYKKQNQ